MDGARILYSIGHSNHPLEVFLNLLKTHDIHTLIDVRSHPYSKYALQFDMKPLEKAVTQAGVQYVFLGKELGGRPEGEQFYDADGYVLYSRVAEAPYFLDGLKQLESYRSQIRTAVLCSEEDPSHCHRRLLIGRALSSQGIQLHHIRGDGRLETDQTLTEQEQTRNGKRQMGMFVQEEAPAWKSFRPAQVASSEAHVARV